MSTTNFACPIVGLYSEALKSSNAELTANPEIDYMNPVMPIFDPKAMEARLHEELGDKFDISKSQIKAALAKAYAAQDEYRRDVRLKGEETLEMIEREGLHGIVLSGRPYHVDPEINHGIPELIQGYGYPVLSEDSISHLSESEKPLRIVNQWNYHKRLYRAANLVAKRDDLDIVQLVSFGCGLDAVTTDQVEETLKRHGKVYTQVKIDEINNLGAVRIRMRSLFSAIRERQNIGITSQQMSEPPVRVEYTK
ncbi:2-hydroxyglutaryl-CoA dehydratase, D-component, partial [Kipferlia bialata]|eukprot:g11962.t1